MPALHASTSDKCTVGLILLMAVLCATDIGSRALLVCVMRVEILVVATFLSGIKLHAE